MAQTIAVAQPVLQDPLLTFVLRVADDHLILSHRLSQWCGHAPMLEEDLALSNIALDMIGQARVLYTYAGEVEGKGRTEDDFAYLRKENEYQNLVLTELPNEDFAHTIVRLLMFSVFADLLWKGLAKSTDIKLAQIAAKAQKETTYHIRHAAQWVIRLGDGTEESARRVTEAVQFKAPYCGEMFDVDDAVSELVEAGTMPDLNSLQQPWNEAIVGFLEAAKIDPELLNVVQIKGGRQGCHSESMGFILTELQYMQRTYPGCKW